MGADESLPSAEVVAATLPHAPKHEVTKLVASHARLGAGDARHIAAREGLAGGNVRVHLTHERGKARKEVEAVVKERRAAQGHRLVPRVEKNGVAAILQKAIPLFDGTRVCREDLAISDVRLGSKRIELSPAHRGRTLYERQVIGAEENREQGSRQVLAATGLAVSQELARAFGGNELDVNHSSIALETRGHTRLPSPGSDELCRRRATERLPRGEVLECLDGIRLSDGIGPHEDRHAGRRLEHDPIEVPISAERDSSDNERHELHPHGHEQVQVVDLRVALEDAGTHLLLELERDFALLVKGAHAVADIAVVHAN